MTQDVTTTNLKVNVLSRPQYETITPNQDELYFVESDDAHRIVGSVSDTAPSSPSDGDTYINTTTGLLYTYSTIDQSWGDGEVLNEDTLYVDGSSNIIYIWDGTTVRQVGGAGGAGNIDGVTTTLNANDEIQAIGVIDKNSGNAKYDWVGTKQEYDALGTYNSNWIYYIVDNSSSGNMSLSNVLNRLNAAYAWTNGANTVYTVPCPVAGFKTYSDPVNLTVLSTITAVANDETTITDALRTYTRDAVNDSVFGDAVPDAKNQFLTVYDLVKAIKG